MFIPTLRRTIFAIIYNTRTGPFTGRVLLLARTIAADAPCFFTRALIELFVSYKASLYCPRQNTQSPNMAVVY